jgi:ABC-2 type transport system ATP-binding protein
VTERPAILAEGVRKRYGRTTALAGLDLTVAHGTVHAVLGPNGAGKTTAVRILTTLLRADGGRAEVLGLDVARRAHELRSRIGLTGQNAAVDERLTGFENLEMFGRLYRLPARAARGRADDLLARFDLVDAASRQVSTYSGGMRRRLDLAASLVISPPMLFLDEPTTGLDPRSRQGMWDVIAALVREGTTVLLTTQYLEEADRLADLISVVDGGRVVAEGSADELKGRLGGGHLELVLRVGEDLERAAAVLRRFAAGEVSVDADQRSLSAPTRDGVGVLPDLIRALDDLGIGLADIALRRPTLDDVFLTLTGHRAGAPGDERPDGDADGHGTARHGADSHGPDSHGVGVAGAAGLGVDGQPPPPDDAGLDTLAPATGLSENGSPR